MLRYGHYISNITRSFLKTTRVDIHTRKHKIFGSSQLTSSCTIQKHLNLSIWATLNVECMPCGFLNRRSIATLTFLEHYSLRAANEPRAEVKKIPRLHEMRDTKLKTSMHDQKTSIICKLHSTFEVSHLRDSLNDLPTIATSAYKCLTATAEKIMEFTSNICSLVDGTACHWTQEEEAFVAVVVIYVYDLQTFIPDFLLINV